MINHDEALEWRSLFSHKATNQAKKKMTVGVNIWFDQLEANEGVAGEAAEKKRILHQRLNQQRESTAIYIGTAREFGAPKPLLHSYFLLPTFAARGSNSNTPSRSFKHVDVEHHI